MTKIIYTKDLTTVINSYLVKDIPSLVDEIIQERIKRGYPIRYKQSYINEIIAHNRLYKLGLFRSRTKDADLEEDIDVISEKLYSLLSIFAKK